MPKTVHIILNAHLDPVWLWPWQAGLDEVLATCNTMCNLLDRYPDAIFTAGEAWRYYEIEKVDPPLFERIHRHVESGQWALAGGWWIQPDCNLPSGTGMRRQIELGREYFLDRFGRFPEVAYNVDSFGHAASLPTIISEMGQRNYVMYRPGDQEMELPARLFRWKESAGSPEILTFRIAGSYATWAETPTEEVIRGSLNALPEGINHTMCFVGVGDHGGGPTARMLDWILEHQQAFDGIRLEFSSPDRFFAAVAADADRCPEVVGELQYHAIGCYSVMRAIKQGVRQAEHQLCQAEMVATPEEKEGVKEAWRKVAFNHFHDILGGTSTPSSYKQQLAQTGAASAQADLIIQRSVRREMVKLPDESRQRIVLKNLSSEPFDGFVEFEPWLRRNTGWKPGQSLMEKDGTSVPYQVIDTEMVNGGDGTRILFRTCMAPMEMKYLLLDESTAPVTPDLPVVKHGVRSDLGFGVALDTDKKMFLGPNLTLPLPRLILDDDPSDNWTHVIDRFPALNSEQPEWQEPVPMEHGPLMNACLQVGTAGRSEFRCEWRSYAHAPFVDLHLRVHWAECRRLLRLELDLPDAAATRTDGIMDGWLERPNQGRECPVRDWTLIPAESGGLGILCPDTYSLSVEGNRLALTLLRSPILTQHDTFPILKNRAVHSDQGEHTFRFRFCCGPMINPEYLDQEALKLHRPPLTADLTRGMPCNSGDNR